jgi:two-component system, LytTR family, response regulator
MNKINFIIIEDEPAALRLMESLCSNIPILNHLKSFKNSQDALLFISEVKVDLIYLDINMPMMNGISFMEALEGKCKVILTTAYSEYALESYKYNVLDYLMKPISIEKLTKATYRFNQINKAELVVPEDDDFFMVQTRIRNLQQKVFYHEITHIQSELN